MVRLVLLLCLIELVPDSTGNEWFGPAIQNVSNYQCNCTNWRLRSNITNYLTHHGNDWSCEYGHEKRSFDCVANNTQACRRLKVTGRYYLPRKRCLDEYATKHWVDKSEPCSKTCGRGVRTNYRVCFSVENSNQPTTYYCKVREVPCNTQPCEVAVASNVYKWAWILSECSVSCFDGSNSGRVIARRQCVKSTIGKSDKQEVVEQNMCTSRMDDKPTVLNCTDIPLCLTAVQQNQTETTTSALTYNTTLATTTSYNLEEVHTDIFYTTTSRILSNKPSKPTSLLEFGAVLVCCLVTLLISVVCAGLVSFYCFGCLERRRQKQQRNGRNLEISSPIPSTLAIGGYKV